MGGMPPELDPSLATAQKEKSEADSLSESAVSQDPSANAAAAIPAIVQKSEPVEDDGRAAAPPAPEALPKLQNPPKANIDDIVGFMGTKSSALGEMMIDGQ